MWSKVKSDPKNWRHHLLIIDWFLYLGFWIRNYFTRTRVFRTRCPRINLLGEHPNQDVEEIQWIRNFIGRRPLPGKYCMYLWIQMTPRSPKLLNLPYHKPILRSNWQPINGSRAFSKTFCRCPSRLRLSAGRIISYQELFQDHYIRVSLKIVQN